MLVTWSSGLDFLLCFSFNFCCCCSLLTQFVHYPLLKKRPHCIWFLFNIHLNQFRKNSLQAIESEFETWPIPTIASLFFNPQMWPILWSWPFTCSTVVNGHIKLITVLLQSINVLLNAALKKNNIICTHFVPGQMSTPITDSHPF